VVVDNPSAAPLHAEDRLVLTAEQRQQLVEHALAGGDDEVCGFLVGRDGAVDHVHAVRNAAAEVTPEQGLFRDRESGAPTAGRSGVHYLIDPKDMLSVDNDARENNLEIVGVYHSHTHTEARPSPTDIRLAHDGGAFFYVLVGLRDRAAAEVRAWRIDKADPWGEDGEAVEVAVVERL
jgi:proteasome lid subunit RPN8/RPN11